MTIIEYLELALREIYKAQEAATEVELTSLFAAQNAIFTAINFLEREGIK